MYKVDRDMAELMYVANFDALLALDKVSADDYVRYLQAHSFSSTITKLPGFHAIISCKGRSYTKHGLTEIALEWLRKMGYGRQPFLLFFHKDSDNNHIHMVTTRVRRSGSKIDHKFEKVRGHEILNEVMGLDEKRRAEDVIKDLLDYRISSHAGFLAALQSRGYFLRLISESYHVYQYYVKRGEIRAALLDEKIRRFSMDHQTRDELERTLEKARRHCQFGIFPLPIRLTGGRKRESFQFSSSMAELLSAEFNIDLLYNMDKKSRLLECTLVDHNSKTIYSGDALLPFVKWLDLEAFGVNVSSAQRSWEVSPAYRSEMGNATSLANDYLPEVRLEIADDQDDEAVHGRERKGSRRKRT
ncbi:relaxase/mobilization nuclease domain-containing protein [Sphingobacterium suaedae]|uniref:Relaxase/mobilization nuclease domain-containing protein n=1 Tax=Sphingobacterium suaedae TaxID=1686402 RepID=A0ABW5KKT3_9SPHI